MKLRRMGYTTTDADGRTVREKSAKWYAVFSDFNGKLRRLALSDVRKAAEGMAAKIAELNELRRADLPMTRELAEFIDKAKPEITAKLAAWDIIPAEKAATAKPLTMHVDDWKAALLAKGSTPQHAGTSAGHIMRIVTGLGLATVADVSASRVQTFLSGLRQDRRDAKGEIHRGISATTFNYHLRDARAFFKWMVNDRRALSNPLEHLKGDKNARIEKRHERRALSVDELRWLLDVTERGYTTTGPDGKPSQVVQAVDRYGMSGADRAMLYRLAVETGLRSAELRSLTRGSFKLDGDTPTVEIAAAYAKNRRQDTLPLKPDTADALARNFAGKMPTAPAFAMPKSDRIIDMMKADLTAARTAWIAAAGTQRERTDRDESTFLAYRDGADRCADFHALRHTFISNLAAGGVHPKTAQRLARHSTITLTMDRYTHLRREDLAGALNTLPDLSSTRQVAVATGTDPTPISLAPGLSLKPEISVHGAESGGIETDAVVSSAAVENDSENSGFSDGLVNEQSTTGVYRSGQTGQTVNLMA